MEKLPEISMVSEIQPFHYVRLLCRKRRAQPKTYNKCDENFEKNSLVMKAFQLHMVLTYTSVTNMREFKFH